MMALKMTLIQPSHTHTHTPHTHTHTLKAIADPVCGGGSVQDKKHKICAATFSGFLPPTTKLGQGYVFTCVCDSDHREGCLPHTTPHWADTPLGRHPLPPGRHPPKQTLDTDNKRAVRILLECNLVYDLFFQEREGACSSGTSPPPPTLDLLLGRTGKIT